MSDSDSAPEAPAPAPVAKPAGGGGVGRGVLYLVAGNIYFIFAGIAIQFGLPAVMSRATFGAYSLVNSIASMFNNVLVTGTQQAVSKFVAQEPDKARHVQDAGLRMQTRIGLGIAAAFIAAAPLVAWLLHDMSKTAPLMLAGLIIGGYAFYAVFVGTANGLHFFGRQAGLTIVFATVRAAALVGAAYLGFRVFGVIGAWVIAVGFILVLAAAWIGMPGKIAPAERIAVGPMIKFFASVAVYLAFFNALMFVDTFLLKRLMSEHYTERLPQLVAAVKQVVPWAPHATGYVLDVSALADTQNAYYAAVQNLARLSYQIVLAATFVAFPLVSRSTFTNDKAMTKRYVEVTARYTLMGAAAIAVVFAANPADVLGLLYAPDFVVHGAAALPALALGNVAFSLIAISGTILNGAGKSRVATIIAAVTLGVAVVGNLIAIPLAAESGHQLLAAASVTAGAMLLGATTYGIVLRSEFGGFLPLLSILRVAVAIAAGMGVGHVLKFHGKLMTIAEAIIVGLVYVITLVATRELGKRDLDAIKSIRKSRARGADAI